MKKILSILIALTFAVSAFSQEYRDVVYLKNGSIIKGFYDDFYTSDSLRMRTIDNGMLVCAFSDIERIAKEKTSVYLVDIGESYKHDDTEWRHRGYRGTIEYNTNISADNRNLRINSTHTTHGYQFNRFLYLGFGVGFEQVTYTVEKVTFSFNDVSMPLYSDLRLYLGKRNIAPVIDTRFGYTVVGKRQIYFNPSLGVDFSFSPRFGIFMIAGYMKQEFDYEGSTYGGKNITFNLGVHF